MFLEYETEHKPFKLYTASGRPYYFDSFTKGFAKWSKYKKLIIFSEFEANIYTYNR
jgi:hypothetical protein